MTVVPGASAATASGSSNSTTPLTQQDKVRRAPGSGPTYVDADLTTQPAGEALVERGLDPSRPTLLVLEGVTMYLREEVVRDQLSELADSSALRTRLAVDFYPPAGIGTSADHRQRRMQRLARAGSDESLQLVVDRAGAIALVESSGWVVTEATACRDAARALVPADSGLPVDAVNDTRP